MRQSIRPVVIPIFGFLLGAMFLAQGARAQTVPAEVPARKSIAILSALGDKVQSMHIGVMVFQNDLGTRQVDWGIDRILTERLEQALGTRFDIRTVAFDPVPLAEAARHRSFFDGSVDLGDALRKSVKPGAADLLLVVTPRLREDPFKNSKATAQGLGIYTVQNVFRGRFFGHAYLVCAMTLFDGQTLKKLGEDKCQNDAGFGEPLVPFRKLEERLYKTKLEDMSPVQLDQLRDAMLLLFDETIPLTLAELKLTTPPKSAKPIPERPPQEESTR